MKSKIMLFFAILAPFLAYSQEQGVAFGNFSFFLSPKILEEGFISDSGLGYRYNDYWGGVLRFRYTAISKNEEFGSVHDSLNAIDEKLYELFLLPAEFSAVRTPATKIQVGLGAYYEYDILHEKGFFNMPALETLTPPRERVNSYTNTFSMHILGPLLEATFNQRISLFTITLSAGIVPIFSLHSSQHMKIVPLLAPTKAAYDQDTWGSPYFYLSIDSVILKYVNLALLYDAARLKYKVIDFDDNLAWINPERTLFTQSFRIEASVLIPLGGDMRAQIGYGYTYDSTQIDSRTPFSSNRQYLILSARKLGF